VIVVDASVLVDFLIGREEAIVAITEALAGREQQPLHAPDLIEPETVNALRALTRAGHVDDGVASQAIADLGHMRLIRYPHAPLRERVWDLRHELTAYDACYLALAEALDTSLLLSADAGLLRCARSRLGAARVRAVPR
jgi:predicted nucleic acid-binding protein